MEAKRGNEEGIIVDDKNCKGYKPATRQICFNDLERCHKARKKDASMQYAVMLKKMWKHTKVSNVESLNEFINIFNFEKTMSRNSKT